MYSETRWHWRGVDPFLPKFNKDLGIGNASNSYSHTEQYDSLINSKVMSRYQPLANLYRQGNDERYGIGCNGVSVSHTLWGKCRSWWRLRMKLMDIFCLLELARRTRYILRLRIMCYSQPALICEREKCEMYLDLCWRVASCRRVRAGVILDSCTDWPLDIYTSCYRYNIVAYTEMLSENSRSLVLRCLLIRWVDPSLLASIWVEYRSVPCRMSGWLPSTNGLDATEMNWIGNWTGAVNDDEQESPWLLIRFGGSASRQKTCRDSDDGCWKWRTTKATQASQEPVAGEGR